MTRFVRNDTILPKTRHAELELSLEFALFQHLHQFFSGFRNKFGMTRFVQNDTLYPQPHFSVIETTF